MPAFFIFSSFIFAKGSTYGQKKSAVETADGNSTIACHMKNIKIPKDVMSFSITEQR